MSFDGRMFRQTLGEFATGVTVIAAETDGVVQAMTANSFTSLSLEPPLVLFCAGKLTRVGQLLLPQSGRFCINILHEEQRDQSTFFAGAWRDAEPPFFAFETWHGAPRLVGSAAAIVCETHAVHEGGDHWIVIGRVVAVDRDETDPRPLLFFRGHYAGVAEG
jgi:3-hydroxy-9,10-secoandrosta-1,3,5(10)-triene-9,17-dione monooxygenase reductase component